MSGLVDNFSDRRLAQTMGTNCAPLTANLFLYSYENDLLDRHVKEGKRNLARMLNLSDLRSSFLIFIPKNSRSLRLQNLLQLLLISTCLLLEMRITT